MHYMSCILCVFFDFSVQLGYKEVVVNVYE